MRLTPKPLFLIKNSVGNKTKTCQQWPNLVSGHLIQVFYVMITFPRQPLLNGPKSGGLIQVWLYRENMVKGMNIRSLLESNCMSTPPHWDNQTSHGNYKKHIDTKKKKQEIKNLLSKENIYKYISIYIEHAELWLN